MKTTVGYIGKTLEEALRKPLPGTDVQWEMASSDRLIRDFPRVPSHDARQSAVLILLYPVNGGLMLPLIQRPAYDGVHGGQIGLPGGMKEEQDRDLTETALREATEETGVGREMVNPVGSLTPLFIPVSNIVVTPVVAWCNGRPHFQPDPHEVDHLIEVNIETIANPEIVREKSMPVRGESLSVKYYDYNGYVIWGATAMILHELITIMCREGIPFNLNR